MFGTGTGAPVPVVTLFLHCLLSEASWGEGLGIPSPLLGCHFGRSCSVSRCCLRSISDLDSFGRSLPSCFRILQFLGSQRIQCMRQSPVLLVIFHTCPCEGGPRILKLILGQNLVFLRAPSYSAVHLFCVLAVEGVQETLDLLGDDLRNFPCYQYASFDSELLVHPSVYGAPVRGSHLFWEMTSLVISAFSAYLLDNGYMYGVSL